MRPQHSGSRSSSAHRCICLAFAASHNSSSNSSADSSRLTPAAAAAAAPAQQQDKYERILAFVDAHATPIVLGSTDSITSSSWSCGPSSSSIVVSHQQQLAEQQQDVTSSWHHSYDEEAEEGEELHEPAVLAYAASVPIAVAAAAAAAESHAAAVEDTAMASPGFYTGSAWSYGNAINPKPFFYAWDEEAEGAFELEPACSTSSASCAGTVSAAAAMPSDPVAAAAALRAQRRAALHEARHAARASRRMRRSQLHPQLGDLERMPAWLQPQSQQQPSQRSAAGSKYAQLLALVAADATVHYRKPKQWHLTFDEDVHGPETVLGSC